MKRGEEKKKKKKKKKKEKRILDMDYYGLVCDGLKVSV